MKARITLLLGALAAFLVFAVVGPAPTPRSPAADGILTPAESQAVLAERLAGLDPESPEAQRLRRLQDKVRTKLRGRSQRTENPGALIEAFAAIKTARDGTTYSAGYRAQALATAHRAKRRGTAAEWTERGPGNISGRARAVVVDPSDASRQTWFAASIGGGIWKTTDGGSTWVDQSPALLTLSTTSIAIAASNPDVIYVGTGMGYGRIVDLAGSGLWKSIDHGETWFQVASTADGALLEAINRIVVDPADPDVVVICSNNGFSHLGPKGGTRISGIFRSIDGGDTWAQTFDPDVVFGPQSDNRVQQIVATPGNFDVLYATVNEVGVVKSIDAGVTWTVSADNFALMSDVGSPSGNGFGLAGISVRTEMAIAPSDPNRLYAAVERPRGVAELFMSQDAGATWAIVHDSGPDPNWFNAFGASGATGNYTAGWFDNTIAVHPYDEDVVFVGGVNLYRLDVDPSNDSRTSAAIAWWIPAGIPVVHADHHWLEMVPVAPPNDFWILGANDGGVAVSLNGGASPPSWTTTSGMVTSQFYGADKKPGENVYIGGMQDNGTAISGTNPGPTGNWNHVIGGDGFEAAWNSEDPSLVLGGFQFGGLMRSTDGGASFTALPDAVSSTSSPFITKIANGKTDPDLVFTIDSNGVNRSDDFGASWTRTPIHSRWLGYRPFDNVEISIADPQVVWISSRLDIDPPAGQRGGIHVSIDGGLSFTDLSANFPPSVNESSGMGTHPVDPATAYMLFSAPGSPKVLRTVDTGATWEDLSGFSGPSKASTNGFPDVAVFSLLVMPFDPDVLWVGTEVGLFVSSDGGASWGFADDGLPRVAIFELSIVDDQVLAATQGRGVWSATLPELAGYTPPDVVRVPRLHPPAMLPSGMLGVEVDLRSAYDRTIVRVDGTRVHTERNNPGPMTLSLQVPVTEVGTVRVEVVSDLDGRDYRAPDRFANVFPTVPADDYATTFDGVTDASDFLLGGFVVTTAAGFAGQALHTPHPYPVQQTLTCVLKTPIRIRSADATIKFKEVVLVEEGVDPNHTDTNFWDYVIVEGTADGATWEPLVPGYDARADPAWSAAYRAGLDGDGDSQTPGDPTLFRDREIDLLQTFAPGQEIFLRFRLFSDQLAVAWGWAIEDLEIQTGSVGIDPGEPEVQPDAIPRAVVLEQNHPNPFNPVTTIRYALPRRGRVSLEIFDPRGRRVRSLVHEVQGPGDFRVDWNGLDDRGMTVASGVYVYRLRTGARSLSRKLTLMK